MSTTAPVRTANAGARVRRYVPFRVVCLIEAFVYLVLFGIWRSWLTPWVTLADGTDHGWVRTPELHRWADSAAAAFYLGLVAALVVLAVRPARSSGLVGALASAGVILIALVGPLVATAPDRRALLHAGRRDPAAPSHGPVLLVLGAGLLVWSAVATGFVVARVVLGPVESPREDDVLSFVLLGLAGALGCWLAVRGREGWRSLTWIVAGLTLYAGLGGLSLALLS